MNTANGYENQKPVTSQTTEEETFSEWDQTRPTVQEISSLAAKGQFPAFCMTYYEWLLWYELRDIYDEWRRKADSEARLKARKENAVARYDKLKTAEKTHSDDCRRIANLFKDIEEAGIAYRKERTLENADRLMNIVYGLLGGE